MKGIEFLELLVYKWIVSFDFVFFDCKRMIFDGLGKFMVQEYDVFNFQDYKYDCDYGVGKGNYLVNFLSLRWISVFVEVFLLVDCMVFVIVVLVCVCVQFRFVSVEIVLVIGCVVI